MFGEMNWFVCCIVEFFGVSNKRSILRLFLLCVQSILMDMYMCYLVNCGLCLIDFGQFYVSPVLYRTSLNEC